MTEKKLHSKRSLLQTIGPGLLFASAAIGTSHLVLSTRAGAHHGMVFIWVIIAALILKYPFFEFGTRYAIATGNSLVSAYRKQGRFAILLFTIVISLNMFAVTGAIGAVSAGLLSTIIGFSVALPILVGLILVLTVALLFFGGYALLDGFIKILSLVLFITITIAFVCVIIKGPVIRSPDFNSTSILEGAGFALLISLVGWMPAGMEASTMNSIWVVEKMRTNKFRHTLKEGLFDFYFGYVFTTILAIMFLVIGAFTVYGSGQLIEGNATQFSKSLISIFTSNLGAWSFWVIAIAAFGTIYGTLISVLDAYARSVVRCIWELDLKPKEGDLKNQILNRNYKIVLPIIAIGGFTLFYFSASSMIKILEFATIIGFITAPIIGFFNIRAITSQEIEQEYLPKQKLIYLAYFGLAINVLFALYYLAYIYF